MTLKMLTCLMPPELGAWILNTRYMNTWTLNTRVLVYFNYMNLNTISIKTRTFMFLNTCGI